MANKALRTGARALDTIFISVAVAFVWWRFGDIHRIWTDLFLVFLTITAYEAITTAVLGATPGKRLLGLRVAELDHAGRPTGPAVLRRAATDGALGALPIVGWAVWAAVALSDPLGRGPADRLAGTMVVPVAFAPTVATRDLPGFTDAVRIPRLSAWGRVADLDVRFRARLRRLTDSPTLAAAIGLLALAASLPVDTGALILVTSLAWILVFTVHETWLVHRTGATPGHRAAGLVIIDRRTGQPPRPLRSFLRAVTLALTLYVPLLWPVLFGSLLGMRFGDRGRGLHDLLGATEVVADPSLAPEDQRQAAMRMRMGRAD